MDTTLTTGEVAAALGTTRSRIHRVVKAGVVSPRSTEGGHLRFTPEEVAVLESYLGRLPRLEGLSREEVMVLAVLGRRPLGLRSIRAVARAARISPTAAGRTLRRLQREGLIKRQMRKVVLGRASEVEVWQANVTHHGWQRVSPALAEVVLPDRNAETIGERGVPRRLRHLFWNVDVSQLDTERDATMIAGRVLASEDAQAHAWAAATLPTKAFGAAASLRSLDPPRRALARNLVGPVDE